MLMTFINHTVHTHKRSYLMRKFKCSPVNTNRVKCTDIIVYLPRLVWVNVLTLHEPPAHINHSLTTSLHLHTSITRSLPAYICTHQSLAHYQPTPAHINHSLTTSLHLHTSITHSLPAYTCTHQSLAHHQPTPARITHSHTTSLHPHTSLTHSLTSLHLHRCTTTFANLEITSFMTS